MRWHAGSQASLLLLVHSVAGINWNQCLTNITVNATATNNLVGLLNANGDPVSNVADAAAISYSLCTSFCGSGWDFQWSAFSQDFSSWLLPYLALISQLPFGAEYRFDNLMSAVLTVGSPVLAGYSLFITLLNSRWINSKFRKIKYPNSHYAVSIVSSLQQVPLGLHPDRIHFASLVVLPENDCWWKYFSQMVDYSHSTWSIASGTSIVWVVVSYILSITSSPTNAFASAQADGGATGSMWLWLIPIVVGWLLLSPKCDFKRLDKAYNLAIQYALTGMEHASPPAFTEKALTITAQEDSEDSVMSPDEIRTPPVFNYSRSLQWASTAEAIFLAYNAASEHAQDRISVSGNDWVESNDHKSIHPGNRLLGSDDQIITYCAAQPRSRWVLGVFTRMVLASCVSLALQWGTVGGAIVIEWFTPTTGMGCRSLGYFIYGAISTVIWMMLLISSILAHYSGAYASSTTLPLPAHVARVFSHFLRRMGKLLAIANSIWAIVTCILQYSNFYDTCFCNSSMISRGKAAAYVTILETTAQVAQAKSAWIGGLVLASASASAFVVLIFLFTGSAVRAGSV